MLGPQNSSLITSSILKYSPYKDWLLLAQSQKEFEFLINNLQGIPAVWLEWVDNEVEKRLKRGVNIENLLIYRIKAIWNGIILLQEGKFICDSVEIAFRQCFIEHVLSNSVSYKDIEKTVPGWENLRDEYENRYDRINQEELLTMEYISLSTYYQLTETIARNWKHINAPESRKKGFKIRFKDKYCRDLNNFRKDMKNIREIRNTIAHSKKLFRPEEITALYNTTVLWLFNLNIELEAKVLRYRLERPRFLEPILKSMN